MRRIRSHLAEPLYRNSYYLMAGLAANALSGFAFWILAARSFPVREVGLAAGMVSAVTFLSYLTSLGLPYAALRFGGEQQSFRSLVNVALLLSGATSLLASVIFVSGVRFWAPGLLPILRQPGDVILFVAFNIIVSCGVLADSFFAAQRAARWAFTRALVPALVKLPAIALLTALGASGLYIAFFGPVSVVTIVLLLGLPLIFSFYTFRGGPSQTPVRQFVRFALRNSPSSLLAGAPVFLLPLIVLGLRGTRGTAYFYVAFGVANVLQLIPTVIGQLGLSEGARYDPWAVAHRARKFALVLLVPAVVLIMAIANPVLSAYGQAYAAHAAEALRWLACASLPWALISVNLSALRLEARDRTVLWATALYCVLTLLLAGLLGTALGLTGIAEGWAVGVAIAALVLEACLWLDRRRGRRMPGWLSQPIARRGIG